MILKADNNMLIFIMVVRITLLPSHIIVIHCGSLTSNDKYNDSQGPQSPGCSFNAKHLKVDLLLSPLSSGLNNV